MMEHIRQFDWCSSTRDTYFLEETDLDNCATEKILRNKFYDPLISSDSENEAPSNVIDWKDICKKRDNAQFNRLFIPGLRPLPPFPKLSALTAQQHVQCLKVLCAENPQILEAEFMPRPTKQDHRVFEEVKEIYAKEQMEFKEWAKSLWAGGQCVRVLRPRPAVEDAARALRRRRLHAARALPPAYQLAAQIPLHTKGIECELRHLDDLINVDATELPELRLPEMIVKRFNIIRPVPVPTPCNKHPCQFVLPNESSMSILPLPELHRELAQFALGAGAACVAGEGALKCLLERDRRWMIPVSVCDVINPEGEKCNVVVLGSEFSVNKESAPTRTYKAFRHLLEYALIPTSERMKVLNRSKNADKESTNNITMDTSIMSEDSDTDEERDDLYIDTECDQQNNGMEFETENQDTDIVENNAKKENGDAGNGNDEEMDNNKKENMEKAMNDQTNGFDEIGFYSCSCKDLSVKPPPRSFKKWQVKNKNSGETTDIIVHCSHKARSTVGEVFIEPIPEYQLDLGASRQSPDKIKSIALSLLLRRRASLLNVRVDGSSGDLVTCDRILFEEFSRMHGDVIADAANTVHTALHQLQGLVPGHYILQHEPSHGSNALLYAARALAGAGPGALLLAGAGAGDAGEEAAPPDDAEAARAPPALTAALLPAHKYRKILPCAFTPHAGQLAREPSKRSTRHKPPPRAIKWPKKKKKKKTANTNI